MKPGEKIPSLAMRELQEGVFECTHHSAVLGREKRFSLILPSDYEEASASPLALVLHGDGRDHLSVVGSETLRACFRESGFVSVFPEGERSWYLDSETTPESRFQSWLGELLELVSEHLKVRRDAGSRAILGWSMGAFGAANYVMRHPGAFKTLGTIIGLLDFPSDSYPPDENYPVSPLFPQDRNRWENYQAALHPECFAGMNIIQAVGKSAFDAGMNAAFHQALNDAGIAHRYLEFDGGHEWSVVAEAMPHLVDFARQAVR